MEEEEEKPSDREWEEKRRGHRRLKGRGKRHLEEEEDEEEKPTDREREEKRRGHRWLKGRGKERALEKIGEKRKGRRKKYK